MRLQCECIAARRTRRRPTEQLSQPVELRPHCPHCCGTIIKLTGCSAGQTILHHKPRYSVTDERKAILSDCLEIASLEVFTHQADPPDFALQRSRIGTHYVEISQQSFVHGGFVHARQALPEVQESIFDLLKDSASGARVYHRRLEECADSPTELSRIFHQTITKPGSQRTQMKGKA